MSFSEGVLAKTPYFRPFLGLKMPFFAHNGPFLGFKKYSNTSSYMLVTIVDHNYSFQTHKSFSEVFFGPKRPIFGFFKVKNAPFHA